MKTFDINVDICMPSISPLLTYTPSMMFSYKYEYFPSLQKQTMTRAGHATSASLLQCQLYSLKVTQFSVLINYGN